MGTRHEGFFSIRFVATEERVCNSSIIGEVSAGSRIRIVGGSGEPEQPQPLKLMRYKNDVGGDCGRVPGGFVIGAPAGSQSESASMDTMCRWYR